MKRLSGLLKVIIIVATTLMAAQTLFVDAAQAGAYGGHLDRLEERVTRYLESHLASDDFMVVVQLNDKSGKQSKNSSGAEKGPSLPGTPGISAEDAGDSSYFTYYDVKGRMMGDKLRPPVVLTVVLGQSVGPKKKTLFRRMIPIIARLDREHGDSFALSAGPINKPVDLREKDEPFLESVMRYKSEVISLLIGLLVALSILLSIQGMFSYLTARVSPKAAGQDMAGVPYHAAPAAPEVSSDDSVDGAEAHSEKVEARRQVRSEREPVVLETIQELRAVVDEHPKRISKMLTDWVQNGEMGQKNAALFIHNFGLQALEPVLQNMVPSDLEGIQQFLDTSFDPISEENTIVVLQAKQSLLKIAADLDRLEANHYFEFLNTLDDDLLKAVLDKEPPKSLALVAAHIPTHRLASKIKSFSAPEEEKFLMALCQINHVADEEQVRLRERLMQKMDKIKAMAFSPKAKVETLSKFIQGMPTQVRQKEMLAKISKSHPVLSDDLRNSIVLFDDILSLPENLLNTMLTEVDPVTIAKAYSGQSEDVFERVLDVLPSSSKEIIYFEYERMANYKPAEIEKAQHDLVVRLQRLTFENVVRQEDLAKFRSETEIPDLKAVG